MGPVDMNSFNHYAYGAVGYWMYGYMMGLQLDENQPGYKHVNIAPVAGGDMTYATTYHDSVFGRVESGWTAEDNEITVYSTAVPANTTATLYLPVENAEAAGGPTDTIVVPGVSYKGADVFNARPVMKYDLESGHYTFYRLDALQALYSKYKDLKESDYTAASWRPLATWLAKHGSEIESALELGLPYAPGTFTSKDFMDKLDGLKKETTQPNTDDDKVTDTGDVTVAIGTDGIPVLPTEPSTARPLNLAALPVSAIRIADKTWTGTKITSGLTASLTYRQNGKLITKALNPNTDYTLSSPGKNTAIGKGSVTITGKGKYKDGKALSFNIVPKTISVSKTKIGKRSLKVSWKKATAAQKVTGYKVQYKQKGAKAWRTKTVIGKSKTSLTIKKLKKGKTYQVRIRAYKTVQYLGTENRVTNKNYYGLWSKTKTSKKIK